MRTNDASGFIRRLCRVAMVSSVECLSDGQLLAAYVDRRDQTSLEALEALVRRHGPMVWGVCRRLLPGVHDAEDAFQATFLVLVRRAASVSPRDMVANWLYGVARTTALKARAMAARRTARESHVASTPEPAAAEIEFRDDDLRRVLDYELNRLPAAYRTAVVLCDLEGVSRKDAAERLGLPEGTVASRVARGRAILARRLARHGLTIAGAIALERLALACPADVIANGVKAVGLAARPANAVSTHVAALVEGVMKSMRMNKLKTPALMLALVGAVALICGWQAYSQPAATKEKPGAQATPQDKDQPKANPKPTAFKEPTLRTTIQTPGGQVKSLAFSPDGKTLASAGRQGPTWTVTTWEVETTKGRLLSEFGHPVYSLTYGFEGKTLAWACDDRAIKVWNFEANRETHNLRDRHVKSVAYSPDGKILSATLQDGTVRSRDMATGKEWILKQHGQPAFALTYSADGKTLAWGSWDNTITMWDVVVAREIAEFKEQRIACLAFSPDGKTLAAAGQWGDPAKLLDATTGKELAAFKDLGEEVSSLAFSPDGKMLVGPGRDQTIRLWDAETGKELAVLKGHSGRVYSVAFSPDGKTLATGGSEKEIRLWDVPGR